MFGKCKKNQNHKLISTHEKLPLIQYCFFPLAYFNNLFQTEEDTETEGIAEVGNCWKK